MFANLQKRYNSIDQQFTLYYNQVKSSTCKCAYKLSNIQILRIAFNQE